MNNPPPPVKITLESVCLMLGEGAPSWRDIRQLINTADFIPRILNFDADQITYVFCRKLSDEEVEKQHDLFP